MMRSVFPFIARISQRFRKDDEGGVSLEFVAIFPIFMFLFLASVEISIFMARTALLERALDMNVRELRLGTLSPLTHEQLGVQVCEDSLLGSECPTAVKLEMTPVSRADWSLPTGGVTCIDRESLLDPVIAFNPGTENQLIIIHACIVLEPFFGTTKYALGLPVQSDGGVAIRAASTFVNEP